MTLDVYTGKEKLCIGIDMGTTMSVVSYAHLMNGSAPRIRLVTRWPGQENVAGVCEVPTVVEYNESRQASQYGAEFVEYFNGRKNKNPMIARRFKQHLYPSSPRKDSNIPPLPQGIGLKTVYTDMLAYLLKHAREFIDVADANSSLWRRLNSTFVLIMTIPKDWGSRQQTFLRDAVIRAGILPQNHEVERLKFVSESEATIYFAINHADISSWLREDTTLAFCGTNGPVAETMVYKCTARPPDLKLEEVMAGECTEAGTTLIDQKAEQFFRAKLVGSKFGTSHYIDEMLQIFEKKTKRKFDGSHKPSVIAFGRARDNDPSYNISKGRITLSSDEVKTIFEPSVQALTTILDSVMACSAGHEAIMIFSGFPESSYLQLVLRGHVQGMQLYNVDERRNVILAEGALVWYINQCVASQGAKAT